VHHAEFGAGIIDQLFDGMAFCTFDEVRDSAGSFQHNARRSPWISELSLVEMAGT
jgi:hypothetical protein